MNKKLLHFKPTDGYLGDCFPVYVNGTYYIYYLKLKDNGSFTWALLTTDDLVNIKNDQDVLLPGSEDSLDNLLLSGCVYHDGKIFHAYYSSYGSNQRYNIMEAVSTDGLNFTKTNKILFEPNEYYEKLDTWRDPEIFYEDGIYHMLFCAKENYLKPQIYAGCIGHATSTDLNEWTLQKPFYSPAMATTLECPDLFKIDDKYVLGYYWHNTKFRIADKLFGKYQRNPIESPTHFDFMAVKTLQDAKRTIGLGWLPRKKCDCAPRDWGGLLAVPKELYFNEKNVLVSKFIAEVYTNYPNSIKPQFEAQQGKIEKQKNKLIIDSSDHGSFYTCVGYMSYLFNSDITVNQLNSQITFFVKYAFDASSNTFNGYQIIFDFSAQKLSIREQYRWDQRPDLASIAINVKENKSFSFELIINQDVLELCIDKEQTLTFRLQKNIENTGIALSVTDCILTLENPTIYY